MMSEQSRLNVKRWLFGAAASLVLSLLVACAGMAAGASWEQFLAVFGAAAATHFGAWMKQHPPEDIE